MQLSAILSVLGRALRGVMGMEAGKAWTPLLVGTYTFLGLIAMALVFAWLTGTPLTCVSAATCE